jgi:prepilin-type processing-associated H-X9-DG protein
MSQPNDPRQLPPHHQPQPLPYNVPIAQLANGMAVTSLVLGIIGMCIPLLAIAALIFGIIALTRTRDPRVGGKGMAISGIVLGGLGILILPLMIAILLPSLNRARETANRVKCGNNMRQIGLALKLYANENRGQFPPNLELLLKTQDITADVFVCPSCNDTTAPGADVQTQAANLSKGGHLSYVYISGFTDIAGAETILLYEPITNHAGDGGNFLFGDAHVEFHARQSHAQIVNSVSKGVNPPK